MDKRDEIEGKNILVVGVGRSGKAAIQAMRSLGANVFLQDNKLEDEVPSELQAYLDEKKVTCFWGCNPPDMGIFDMIILSPGVPPELNFIKEGKDKGAEIIGELEIAYRYGKGKYVAITGTNGKTTTTTLVGEIYKKAGRKTHVVGNIGVAVISKSLHSDNETWLITETSSFQLETIKNFSPVISAILNITPDHMDRHKNMRNYIDAKADVFKNQTDEQYCVLNYDDSECMKISFRCNATLMPFSRKKELDFGAYVKNGKVVIKDKKGDLNEICAVDEILMPGDHNLENVLAAAAISYCGGIEPCVISKVVKEFKGVEHRIELCNKIDGIKFVNDSKGTNPDAAIKALEALKKDIILIAGGYDKNSDFDEFVGAFEGRVKAALLIGKTATKIKGAAEKIGFKDSIILKDMQTCVKEAYRIAQPGDIVLLSPACASWDMYSNFEQRGNHFKECVEELER